jgi:hypothetical protein
MANDPLFATLKQFAGDLGIPTRVTTQRLVLTGP